MVPGSGTWTRAAPRVFLRHARGQKLQLKALQQRENPGNFWQADVIGIDKADPFPTGSANAEIPSRGDAGSGLKRENLFVFRCERGSRLKRTIGGAVLHNQDFKASLPAHALQHRPDCPRKASAGIAGGKNE